MGWSLPVGTGSTPCASALADRYAISESIDIIIDASTRCAGPPFSRPLSAATAPSAA